MKILFHENQLGERGTSVALYDYALYARSILNIDPIICYNARAEHNNESAINKFKSEFEVIGYEDFSEVDIIAEKNNAEYFYAIKYGTIDNIQIKSAKNLMHSVYCADASQYHGDRYATVSEWQSALTDYKVPYVPHMINLPDIEENFRKELGIPEDHIVFGRHGGIDTFDVPFVNYSIAEFLDKRQDVWFLLMNTPAEIRHDRCLYFDINVDLTFKTKFINTCDIMIHGGFRGETFGISILEFATRNKQIITFDNYVGGRNHHLYLKDNYHLYSNKEQLDSIFNSIGKENQFDTLYLNDMFSPQVVMSKFQQVFLS